MNALESAFVWLGDPANWSGPNGIPTRLAEHVEYSFFTLVFASIIAIPIGYAIGHTRQFRGPAIALSGALRALPTLGLLVYIALLFTTFGLIAPYIALTILAIPPILAGAYAGIEAVDPRTVDAARGLGMTEFQILRKVEIPLGLPLLMGGVRAAALQVIATWTVAAYLPVGGLGRYVFDGLSVQRYDEMLGGSILVIALALVADGIFALVQRWAVPRGVVAGRVKDVRAKAIRARTAVAVPVGESTTK